MLERIKKGVRIKVMKKGGVMKKNGLIHAPPFAVNGRKETKKKKCSSLNIFGRIEERKEGNELGEKSAMKAH